MLIAWWILGSDTANHSQHDLARPFGKEWMMPKMLSPEDAVGDDGAMRLMRTKWSQEFIAVSNVSIEDV